MGGGGGSAGRRGGGECSGGGGGGGGGPTGTIGSGEKQEKHFVYPNQSTSHSFVIIPPPSKLGTCFQVLQ